MRTRDGLRERRPVPTMQGAMARWYTRQRGSAPQLALVAEQAAQLSAGLPAGARVLEVAPGPGYLAVELARLGHEVTGLDLSQSFVDIATRHAQQAGVTVAFRQGDAADLPFEDESFDLVVCQAAFKNFTRPVDALDQLHRVLRPGGVAVIQDMRRDAPGAAIRQGVAAMGLGPVNAAMTRLALVTLRLRALSQAQFERLAAASAFGSCTTSTAGIGIEVRLTRSH
jgi:ubiquinone/menaquinone biosynthesis C-methylase UbiE